MIELAAGGSPDVIYGSFILCLTCLLLACTVLLIIKEDCSRSTSQRRQSRRGKIRRENRVGRQLLYSLSFQRLFYTRKAHYERGGLSAPQAEASRPGVVV